MYREQKEDWTLALHLFCFTISSLQFSVSKRCAGPNVVLDAFVNIIFTEWLYDEEFSVLVVREKIRLVIETTMNPRNRSNVFASSRYWALFSRALALWFWSPWSSITVTRDTMCIIGHINWFTVPFLSSTFVRSETAPITHPPVRSRCSTIIWALIWAARPIVSRKGAFHRSKSMIWSLWRNLKAKITCYTTSIIEYMNSWRITHQVICQRK